MKGDSKGTAADPQGIRSRALELIRRQSTLTLATARANVAWAAPVYYVFHGGAFHFFSAPDARHIEEANESGEAAGSIHAHAESWQDIRGLQMAGQIREQAPGWAAVRVLTAYIHRYPFTKEFFSPGRSLDLKAFSERFRVRLYGFHPSLVYYLDNQIRFGFREPVTL